jgi:D-3-phosphoglycerate dehydrogenase
VSDPLEALILDLLEWIGPHARPYREVMDAWRTSCPRLSVWEEATDRGFIEHHRVRSEAMVSVSAVGARYLAEHRHIVFPGRVERSAEPPAAPEPLRTTTQTHDRGTECES